MLARESFSCSTCRPFVSSKIKPTFQNKERVAFIGKVRLKPEEVKAKKLTDETLLL